VPGVKASVTTGTQLAGPEALARPSYRLVGLGSPNLESGSALLAGELGYTDGPFLDEQGFRRGAALGKLTMPWGPGTAHLTATYYAARWNQSGRIPETEVEAGRLDRFGSLDPTEVATPRAPAPRGATSWPTTAAAAGTSRPTRSATGSGSTRASPSSRATPRTAIRSSRPTRDSSTDSTGDTRACTPGAD
jgi:hypothetical protein